MGYITQRLQRPIPCIRFRIFVSSHLAFVSNSYFFVYFVRLLLVLDLFLLTCQLRSISFGWWGSLYLLNWCLNMYMKSSKNLYLYLICTCLLVTWEAYSSVGEDPCGAERARRQLSMGPHRDRLEPYLAIGVGLTRFRMNSCTILINEILVGFRCCESSITKRVCRENLTPVVDWTA